ncbi:hypothetical protein BDC45DRAFT_577136 [Circinella umbellata]|nr:hypothetical protein BDC45DRAFT_577136 [Circinella umbellata]
MDIIDAFVASKVTDKYIALPMTLVEFKEFIENGSLYILLNYSLYINSAAKEILASVDHQRKLMPRYSKKRQVEYALGIMGTLETISSTTAMLIDDGDADCGISYDPEDGELHNEISSRRYLDRSQKVAHALSRINWLFNEQDDKRLIQEVRMSKDAFYMILDKIKDSSIFISSGSKPQKPVLLQLLVTTRWVGFYGNGASVGNTARYYGVGDALRPSVN